MPHHVWGDEWFEEHGNDLYAAVSDLYFWLVKVGRIGSHIKEKWGTIRDCVYWWDGTITYLMYPGYVRIMTPMWFYWHIDRKVIRPVLKYTGAAWLIDRYMRTVYNFAYQRVCKKYPKIIDEIVSDADLYMFIRPGLFGSVDGTAIHNKYWKKIK